MQKSLNSVSEVERDENYLRQKSDEAKATYMAERWNIWMDFAGTTTLHGPIHITTTSGFTRLYYIAVVVFMVIMFITHTTNLTQQYFSYPILTEIKYNNLDYSYPDITICPSSPFTTADAENNSNIMQVYKAAEAFWWQTDDVMNASPSARIKRSVTRRFFEQSGVLGRMPHRHVIHCRVRVIITRLHQMSLTQPSIMWPKYKSCKYKTITNVQSSD